MKQIYVIKNIVNDKAYVGQAASAYDRFRRHRNNRISAGKQELEIVNAMKEIGAENFYFILLENCTDEDADEREKYYIEKFDSYRNGYNHTIGGMGVHCYTEEDIQECYRLFMNGSTIKEISESMHMDHHVVKRELEKIVPNYKEIVNRNFGLNVKKTKNTPVNQYDMDGNFIRRYKNVREALDTLGIDKKVGSISNCCKHRTNYNSAYGFKWEYAE